VAAALAADAIKVDFGNWDRSRWLPVREARFPAAAPFVQRDAYIENFIAPGHDEKEIVAAKDGLGVAMMLRRDFRGADVGLRCTMSFERQGAPAIIFRVQRQGDVTGEMYSLVLYHAGLNLWKFSGGKWSKVDARKFEVAPSAFHEVRVYARGGDFFVYLDGARKMACSDPEPLPAGEVGIWSGEGPCRFGKFVSRPLASGR